MGDLSSLILPALSPSVNRSIRMNMSVKTVCGQAYPHHSLPAKAVKAKSATTSRMRSMAR